MAKFYDGEVYELSHILTGDEVFIIYQDEVSKTAETSVFATDLAQPLIDNLFLNDLVDVTYLYSNIILDSDVQNILDSQGENLLDDSIIGLDNVILGDLGGDFLDDLGGQILDDKTASGVGDVLSFDSGFWIKSPYDVGNLTEIQDVTITSPQENQMIMWGGSYWNNTFSPELRNYTETEYNIGTISGTYDIDLVNGNIQKITLDGDIIITLPLLPLVNKYWSLTLKVVSDGTTVPTFVSTDGDIKWSWEIEPNELGNIGNVNIYVFVSDIQRHEIYGTLSGNFYS